MEKDLNDISNCPFHNGSMKKNIAGGEISFYDAQRALTVEGATEKVHA